MAVYERSAVLHINKNLLILNFKKMNVSKMILATACIALMLFVSCSKDEDNGSNVTFEITDAPIDNANVSGAFVTISEIKVDGQSWSGFSGKKTVDLLALQNGNTSALGSGKLDVGSYSNIELVLDYAQDANGNVPGCYVMTSDNGKIDLNSTSSTTGSIVISGSSFDVASESSSAIVIDFDLRKAIQKGDEATDYSFKSSAKLNAALRAEAKATTGNIVGQVDKGSTSAEKVVVFAYKSGTYSDAQATSDANTQFEGAVTSALVASNGNYQLSFLEEGDYDLVFCNYEENNNGELVLEGKLSAGLASSLGLFGTTVTSNSSVTLNVVASGMLSF